MADPRGDVKDGDNFLLNFIKNKRLGDKEEDEEEAANYDKKGHDSEESLNELDRTDTFDEKYNFCFKDEAASSVPLYGAWHSNVGYARSLSGDTLRGKDGSRSHKRTASKERKAEERKAKE